MSLPLLGLRYRLSSKGTRLYLTVTDRPPLPTVTDRYTLLYTVTGNGQ